MGTQQLLLIVLGVIIVGVAIAVGITIFNTQAYNSNRQAVAAELSTYAHSVLQWWKTPVSQGGAGKEMPDENAEDAVAVFIGFVDSAGAAADLTTDTGTFSVDEAIGTTVKLTGEGTEKRGGNFPDLTTTVNLETGEISTADTP